MARLVSPPTLSLDFRFYWGIQFNITIEDDWSLWQSASRCPSQWEETDSVPAGCPVQTELPLSLPSLTGHSWTLSPGHRQLPSLSGCPEVSRGVQRSPVGLLVTHDWECCGPVLCWAPRVRTCLYVAHLLSTITTHNGHHRHQHRNLHMISSPAQSHYATVCLELLDRLRDVWSVFPSRDC